MFYLPTSCRTCRRVALRLQSEAERGELVCTSCGETAQVVPGCGYTEEDIALFGELSQIVGEDAIAQLEAEQMALDAHDACAVRLEREALARLVARFPSLARTQGISERPRGRKVLLMLATIFDALALTPTSATMPAAISPQEKSSALG
jgi:hypothetical protein